MNKLFDVIKGAHLTEKSSIQNEKDNTFVFLVDPRASKLDVKAAVSKLLGKKVVKVTTCNCKGKIRQRGQVKPGRDANWKKAQVRLSPGEKIDLV